MRKKSVSIILTLALALSMLFGSMTVSAADAAIDTTKNGSVTLWKYEGKKDDNKPVEGAGFSFYKILSYGENGYQLTELAKEAVLTKDPDADLDKVIDSIVITDQEDAGEDGYAGYGSAEELEGMIADFHSYINAHSVTADTLVTTGENGSAKASNLGLGVYLVTETTVPGGYIATTAPFLVAVPYWQDNTAGWVYDVTAYPKDQTFNVDKSITEGDDSQEASSYEIGDTVSFEVKGTVPDYGNSYSNTTVKVTQDRTIVSQETYNVLPFVFADTLSGGLTYNNDLKITIPGTSAVTLKQDTGATYNADDGTVTWTSGDNAGDYYLTTTGHTVKAIIKWASIDQYQGSPITFSYSATINEDAAATGGNTNSATISVANNPATFGGSYKDTDTEEYTSSTDTSTVYTYQLSLDKTFNGQSAGDAKVNASSVKFTVADSDEDTKTDYKFIQKTAADGKAVPGEYVLWTGGSDGKTLVTELSMSEAGKLTITGLEDKTYYITETKTVDGYSVLAKPVAVTVSDVSTSTTETTVYHPYIAYAAGDFKSGVTYYTLSGGAYTEIGQNDLSSYVSTADAIKVVYYAETKTVTAPASSNVAGTANGQNMTTVNGTLSLNINNSSNRFNLPQTGGTGLWLFTIAGGIAMAAGIIVFSVVRRSGRQRRRRR